MHVDSSMNKNMFLFRFVGNNKLSDLLLQPYDLLKPGWADSYLLGLVNQVSWS